ncbi:hypothetical protein Ciccas_003395 [Cichlidogyrus casuarinus]|uniref:Uncharacterized protein n=1 Tax=Cichlidogyrus casuarinus TaxID=1844966 RepID=A0ABD2QEH8_9PLAT
MCPLDNNDLSEKAQKEDVFLTTEARHYFWPPDLACRLIDILKQCKSFTQKVAMLFKNFVDCLELDYYPLVTGEMLSIFAKHWPDLCILKLNGLQDGQVSPNSLLKIAQLRHLKELYLNGVRSVNDDNISSLATLPNLRVLDIGRTRVTDVGWHRMMAPACLILERLDVTGMSEGNLDYVGIKPILPPALTDAGFQHILKLFPALKMLTVSKTSITGASPPDTGVINTQLETLILTDCEKLAFLPVWISSVKEFKLNANVPLTFDTVFDDLQKYKLSSRVEKIVGLFSLNSFCREAFLRLVQLNLHLTDFNFSTCGKDWLTLPILLEFLRSMAASQAIRSSIRVLTLPYKRFHFSESSANELIDALSEFKQLTHLNFGNQLSFLHVYSLEPLFRQLCRLSSVTITHGM